MRPLILASLVVGLLVGPLTAVAQSTSTTSVVTVVNPQGSGNTTSTATAVGWQPVAVTAAVTAGSGTTAPDGTVGIYLSNGDLKCTATLGSPVGLTSTGTCNLTLPICQAPPLGVIASYAGSTGYAASISSGASNGSLQVNKAATTTAITAHTPNPSSPNSPIAVTAVVTVVPPGAGVPGELIKITDGTEICFAPSGGSCNLTPMTPGTLTLTATYPVTDVFHDTSVSPPVTHTVSGSSGIATTSVVTVVNPQGSGNTTSTATAVGWQPVAVTAAVTAGSGTTAPDGTVGIYLSNGDLKCTATLGSPVGLTSTGTCNLGSDISPGAAARSDRELCRVDGVRREY